MILCVNNIKNDGSKHPRTEMIVRQRSHQSSRLSKDLAYHQFLRPRHVPCLFAILLAARSPVSCAQASSLRFMEILTLINAIILSVPVPPPQDQTERSVTYRNQLRLQCLATKGSRSVILMNALEFDFNSCSTVGELREHNSFLLYHM